MNTVTPSNLPRWTLIAAAAATVSGAVAALQPAAPHRLSQWLVLQALTVLLFAAAQGVGLKASKGAPASSAARAWTEGVPI